MEMLPSSPTCSTAEYCRATDRLVLWFVEAKTPTTQQMLLMETQPLRWSSLANRMVVLLAPFRGQQFPLAHLLPEAPFSTSLMDGPTEQTGPSWCNHIPQFPVCFQAQIVLLLLPSVTLMMSRRGPRCKVLPHLQYLFHPPPSGYATDQRKWGERKKGKGDTPCIQNSITLAPDCSLLLYEPTLQLRN